MNYKKAKTPQKHISIKGANLHNLKNINVDIPHNKLTVITGVSGSGKSTLAFDTLYAEGQRRFVESLSAYARQFLERLSKPDVESITGLPPALAIEQRKYSRNPRSTVGTSTEIYDYLRLLFGRIGVTICRSCNKEIKRNSPDSVIKTLLKLKNNTKLYILAPLSPQTRSIEKEFSKLSELGFFRFVKHGSDEIYNFDDKTNYENQSPDIIHILIDRVIINQDKDTISRITDSLEQAFKVGNGKIIIKNLDKNEILNFSSNYECPDCDIVYVEPEPRLFSFNNPFGACPSCQGFGRTIGIDEDLIIPDKSKSLLNNAIHPFRTPKFSKFQDTLIQETTKWNIPVDIPYNQLSTEQKDLVWNGFGTYEGINGFVRMLEENNYKMHYRILLSKYRGYTTCHACGGSRLRTSARQVYIQQSNIPSLIEMPIDKLLEFFSNLKLTKHQYEIAGKILDVIKNRLNLLNDIGLHYLTLNRLTHTLSGGEAQRINLATALGSSLVGTLYVLDEPSIGMHPSDTEKLLKILFKLRNLGNTIVVVEHDIDIINHADYLIDLGPLAGEFGGELVFSGTPDEITDNNKSLTCQYLLGKKQIEIPKKKNKGNGKKIELIKPRKHNLRMEQVSIPLGCIVVITGVSGSGKSTLVHDVLYEGLKHSIIGNNRETDLFEKINGSIWLDNVEMVDQSSIGKSSRSTPVTYTKVFDYIRELFASTQAAKQLAWSAGYFSFNIPGGRCDACNGEGFVTVDMQFLPDVTLLCESCNGTRYKREARNILYKGKSITDVLNMTIDEAASFFSEIPKISKKLQIMQDVGLGYLRLGQPSTMLSGGEAQRIKLAGHLDAKHHSSVLYIFDEPTTGLHLDDIDKLLKSFRKLIDAGNSVVIIEHNLHVIAAADWLIDLGPGAGFNGGLVVAEGTPAVVSNKNTQTGLALKQFLNRINR